VSKNSALTCFANTQHAIIGILVARQNGPYSRLISVAVSKQWRLVMDRLKLVEFWKEVTAVSRQPHLLSRAVHRLNRFCLNEKNSAVLPTCIPTPALHLITTWPWPLTFWSQGQCMPSNHAPSLVLTAQAIFLLQHGHRQTDRHSTHGAATFSTGNDCKTAYNECVHNNGSKML